MHWPLLKVLLAFKQGFDGFPLSFLHSCLLASSSKRGEQQHANATPNNNVLSVATQQEAGLSRKQINRMGMEYLN